MGISTHAPGTLRKSLEPMSLLISSLSRDRFDPDAYDIAPFSAAGKNYRQTIVSEDLPDKKKPRTLHSLTMVVVLAICEVAFQLLGQYYIGSFLAKRIEGLGIYGPLYAQPSQQPYIEVISKSHNGALNLAVLVLRNPPGRTFLAGDEKPLWVRSSMEMGTTKRWVRRVPYKNVFGSYFHGPILSRNANLAYRLVSTALKINMAGPSPTGL